MHLPLKSKHLKDAFFLILLFCSSMLGAQQKPNQKLFSVFDAGVPACPETIVYTQPSGQKISFKLKGDGALNWAETLDGYKLIANNKGSYCYAISDNSNGLKSSGIEASDISKRTSSEKSLLKSIDKSKFFSSSFIEKSRSQFNTYLKSGDQPQYAFPTKGETKLLAILVEFTDVPFYRTKQEFDDLFNKKGYDYNGATGSVADYFRDNSFGLMNLKVDVVGPYKLSHNMAYYGAKDGTKNDIRPQDMATEAIKLADPYVDFSQYDNDKDGAIDGVYIIYAGYGQEAGTSTDAIWAHAWSIPTLNYDNTRISRYSCSAELKGYEGNNGINKFPTHIGVICHEFLHVCGLPDYYDVDGDASGGDSRDLGAWDTMANGNWNNGGRTPPFVNCHSRYMLGWGTIDNLSTGKGKTLQPTYKSNTAFGVSTIENEHYFFENRQKVSWDSYLPWHGMIAYHVQYDANRWRSNKVNIYPTHQCFDLIEATPDNPSDRYSPFPGLGNVTSFSAYGNPAFVNWDGSNLNMQLSNIAENGEIITFDAANYGTRDIYIKLTHDNNTLKNFKVTYNGITYTSNDNGYAVVKVPLEASSISSSVTINETNTFATSITLNSTDNNYTIPLKRVDFKITGTSAQTPKASVTIAKLGGLSLANNEVSSIYTPNFGEEISYSIKFDNDQVFSQKQILSSSESTETIALPFNQYIASILTGDSKLSGFEVMYNNVSYSSDKNGEIVLYVPSMEDKFTLNSVSKTYHDFSQSYANNSSTNNRFDIEVMRRNQMEVMSIAPNPVKELPMVIFVSEDGTIDFYSTMGNKLHTQAVKVGKNLIWSSNIKSGIVLVRFNGKATTETKRALIL